MIIIIIISSREHCQRHSPSRISDTPQAGFETAQNLISGSAEWSCAVVITTTPFLHHLFLPVSPSRHIFCPFEHIFRCSSRKLLILNILKYSNLIYLQYLMVNTKSHINQSLFSNVSIRKENSHCLALAPASLWNGMTSINHAWPWVHEKNYDGTLGNSLL